MKRNVRTKTEQKNQSLKITGSRVKKTWDEPEDADLENNFKEAGEDTETEDEPQNRKGSTRLLTMIQISACTIVLIAAVALRLTGGSAYENIKSWYVESLNNSIIADSQMDNVKHVVLDLWSKISSSRAESSQAVSSSGEENSGAASKVSSGTAENGAASGTAQSQDNISASSETVSQENAASSTASTDQSPNNAANNSSVEGNTASSSASS